MNAGMLVERLKASGVMVATAESCTGGLVAAAVTEVSGSSAVFDRGFVTYSNDAKIEMLGVPPELIVRHGAVSAEVAAAMVTGALLHSRADIGVSVTGIAGPGGGSLAKPVGLVHFACQRRGQTMKLEQHHFSSRSRSEVRAASVNVALRMIGEAV